MDSTFFVQVDRLCLATHFAWTVMFDRTDFHGEVKVDWQAIGKVARHSKTNS